MIILCKNICKCFRSMYSWDNKDIINILTCLNENYIEYLDILINSLVEKSKSNIRLFICVWDIVTQELIQKQIDISRNIKIEIIVFEKEKIQKLISFQTLHPPECYFRILIQQIIPTEIKKIIYLDPDIIVNKSLEKLYHVYQPKLISGVRDHCCEEYAKKYIKKLTWNNLEKYINAGVLIINMEKWRKNNIEEKMISNIKKFWKELKLLDQDLINIVLKDDIDILPAEWNHFYPAKCEKNNICIYHMVGRGKWLSILNTSLETKMLYLKYSNNVKNRFLYKSMIMCSHLLISWPLGLFIKTKYKIRYKFKKNTFLDYMGLILLAYPPVMLILLRGVYREYAKFGKKEILKSLWEIIK